MEKFLDNATLAQVERVRIIHGHGMGVLKKAVADLLKHSPHVETYYIAPPEERSGIDHCGSEVIAGMTDWL